MARNSFQAFSEPPSSANIGPSLRSHLGNLGSTGALHFSSETTDGQGDAAPTRSTAGRARVLRNLPVTAADPRWLHDPWVVIWQESGQTPGSLGLRLEMLATVLVFQALLWLLVYWTLRRPNRSRVVRLLVSLPVVATLFVIVLYAVGRARF